MLEITEDTELFATLVLGGEIQEGKDYELGSLRLRDVPELMVVAVAHLEENVDMHDNYEDNYLEITMKGMLSCHKCQTHDDVLMRGSNPSGSELKPTCGQCLAKKETYRLRDYFVPSLGRQHEIRNGYSVMGYIEGVKGKTEVWVEGMDLDIQLALIQGGKAY